MGPTAVVELIVFCAIVDRESVTKCNSDFLGKYEIKERIAEGLKVQQKIGCFLLLQIVCCTSTSNSHRVFYSLFHYNET